MNSTRKLSRRSFLTRVAGGVVVGGGALLMLPGKAQVQVSDNDTGPHADRTGSAPASPASTRSPVVNGGARQDFTLVNNSGHVLVTLNMSPTNQDNWGPDVLGRDTLVHGRSMLVTVPRTGPHCSWDIRATYDDGTSRDMRGVDLCSGATVTLRP